MNKWYFTFAIALIAFGSINAQDNTITAADLRFLRAKEDSLKKLSLKVVNAATLKERLQADSVFTRIFVRALKTRHSFQYPFDSVNVSKLTAPDLSFKIFTWQLNVNDQRVRQHGAIQMQTSDGSLKLFPLIDKSDVIENPADTITSNLAWPGALYYKIIKTVKGEENIYTLLGFDENSLRSNKKIIEILKFVNGKPVFGDALFTVKNDDINKGKMQTSRYIMEYKKDSKLRLFFDETLKMIIVEHMVSESNEPKKKWTYIPDGDYDGFVWKNDQWLFVNKIYDNVTPEGAAPVPEPLRDKDGNIDFKKLKVNEGAEENINIPEEAPKQKVPAKKTKQKGN